MLLAQTRLPRWLPEAKKQSRILDEEISGKLQTRYLGTTAIA
jgi:hypothetical protein